MTHANYGIFLGNFEMDLNDGEVRFKSSCQLNDSELTAEMVKRTVAVTVTMADRFFPGLMAVVYGGKDPKVAYDDCVTDLSADANVRQAQ